MPTALILEDDGVVLATIKAMLKSLGWTVLLAESAAQAWATSTGHMGPIHLLITDVALPKVSGATVATILALKRSEMACLLVSGYPLAELCRRALLKESLFRSRRYAFLPKPFTFRALRDCIGRLIQRTASS